MKKNRSSADGILLVGHGTRDEVGTAQFFELAGQLSKRVEPVPVEPALLEFAKPTIPEAWRRLVSVGVSHVRVAPLLLFAAGHARQDVPTIIGQCQANDPHLTFDQSRPISRHRSIIELATQRIRAVLDNLSTSSQRTAVIFVGRGNRDSCAQADMRVLSEVVARRIQIAAHFTAFYAMAQPSLTKVLQQVALSGRFDHVVVYPHLLFEGRLHQSIVQQTKQAAEKHAGNRISNGALSWPAPIGCRRDRSADRALRSLSRKATP